MRAGWLTGGAIAFAPGTALAGMPVYFLTDLASLRLETISLFLLVVLIVGLAVQRIWNRLGLDFDRLPRLSYRGALACVVLWGLAFQLVLTMISGARELLTPGAWERDRSTYKLRTLPPSESDQLQLARRQQLERLRSALWQYAERNGGSFPRDDYAAGIPEGVWTVLDPSGLHYIYVGGSRPDATRTPLAFEPGIYGRERLALFTNGEIEALSIEQIYAAFESGES